MTVIKRYKNNPIITPDMVVPSNPGYKVCGVFNPAATFYNDEIILLLRVAETCEKEDGFVSVPIVKFDDKKSSPSILRIKSNDPGLVLKDTRGVVYNGVDYLSSLSHLRLARSSDGFNFKVEDKPFMFPCSHEDMFGVEDARITYIDGFYYINYSVVSNDSWATALARTKDFENIEKLGIIFPPENKDVSIFPEKINGKYCALHRPNNNGFGKPSIWYAESPDLIYWGNHKCILRPQDSYWEKMKIGGGAPCIKTEQGWLQIYHAKGENQIYSLFALLLDYNEPSKIIAKSKEPILKPEMSYEKEGFFPNCVFVNGIIQKGNKLLVYYGACDEYICTAESSVDEILSCLER